MPTQSPSPRDLVTVLYQPAQTMRRVLDSGRDRWTVQLVVLAVFCTSFNDPDMRGVSEVLPGLRILPMIAIILLGLIAAAAAWTICLFIASWVTTFVGRLFGGTGSPADVRAALAWGIVPTIWSVFYRIPLMFVGARYRVPNHGNIPRVFADFAARGGCALIVGIVALQFVFFAWCIFVSSFTIAEAQRFSPAKGLANLAFSLILPVALIAAAVFAFRK